MSDQNSQTNLDLVDLRNLLMIIDVASQRGAFKAPELSQVGSVFDRVNKFLESVTPKTDQNNQETVNTPVQPSSPVGSPVSSSSVPPFSIVGANN
jgi:hypothetical protein